MSFYNLGLSLHLSYGATKTTEGNQEKLIDEDPTKYRRLVEAYVNETMRPLDPLGIHDGEITYVKQVLEYEFYMRQNESFIVYLIHYKYNHNLIFNQIFLSNFVKRSIQHGIDWNNIR